MMLLQLESEPEFGREQIASLTDGGNLAEVRIVNLIEKKFIRNQFFLFLVLFLMKFFIVCHGFIFKL